MGQPVAVTQTPAGTPGRVRFEINRSITGQGHERFASVAEATGSKPAAMLARSLFGTGKVKAVHVFSNIVTVDVADATNETGLSQILKDMYQYWKPGMEPKSVEELTKSVASTASGDSSSSPEPTAEAGVSAAASRIPAALLARSQAALKKARANQG
jgi:hypothetical protein